MSLKISNQANRGRSFEEAIEATNKQYQEKGLAMIQKIPTPWIVKRAGSKIVSAFPAKKSTVDFIGMVNTEFEEGIPVAFEAKETTGAKGKPETNFPLYVRNEKTIKEHQMGFLRNWNRMGGHGFILVHFKNRDQHFAVTPGFMREWYKQENEGGRKSIPFEAFTTQRKVNIDDYLEINP
jgi:recombination protein U